MNKIYVCSWGYEQTNVNFYQVVKETEKSLWLQEIGSRIVKELSPMSHEVMPNEDDFFGEVFMVRKSNHGKINTRYGYASLWNERPVFVSEWY